MEKLTSVVVKVVRTETRKDLMRKGLMILRNRNRAQLAVDLSTRTDQQSFVKHSTNYQPMSDVIPLRKRNYVESVYVDVSKMAIRVPLNVICKLLVDLVEARITIHYCAVKLLIYKPFLLQSMKVK